MKFFRRFNISLFTITLGNLEFKPNLFPTLVTIAFLYLLISLGQWQISRADYKDEREQLIEQRHDESPVALADAPTEQTAQLYMPVKTQGVFDDQHQIYLDNRVVNHKAGYDIYTPLKLQDGTAILVKRGWIQQGRTRDDLPDISIDQASVNVRGILSRVPSSGLILSENVNRFENWPTVVQYIDLHQLEQVLGYKLFPSILILDKQSDHAYHQQPIKFNMTSDKHLGYAFQWFGLAVALITIYFVVNTKRRKP